MILHRLKRQSVTIIHLFPGILRKRDERRILNLPIILHACFMTVDFLPARLGQPQKVRLPLDAQETPPYERRGNAGGTASRKRIEYPRARLGADILSIYSLLFVPITDEDVRSDVCFFPGSFLHLSTDSQ